MSKDQEKTDRISASKAAYEARRRRVTVAFRDLSEMAAVKRAARAHGLPVSTYLREAERAYREQHYLVPKDQAESLTKLISLVRNIGNSLNRVAMFTSTLKKKRTWFGQKPFDWKEAESKAREFEELLRDFVERPPREESDKP